MTISKPVRATEEAFKELKLLAVEEGRTIGKMLEIAVKEYKRRKSDGQSEHNQRISNDA